MDNSDDKKPKVGRGQPPVEHQFSKGKSGNPRGRPRKQERAFSPRQVRRDVLAVTEAPTTVRTAGGEQTVPAIVAILLVARQKALAGHGPSIRLMLGKHAEAISIHYEVHLSKFEMLEHGEVYVNTTDPKEISKLSHDLVNRWRKGTRKP